MNIKLNAEVFCQDGQAGHVTGLIINPNTDMLTHLVVKRHGDQYLVPIELLQSADEHKVTLKCTKAMLLDQTPFVETEYVPSQIERYEPTALLTTDPYLLPYYEPITYRVQHEHIPEGEVDIRLGMPVFAKDKRVGYVDDVVTTDDHRFVTHIVMHKGHLWGARTIVIPVSNIKAFTDDGIQLRLTEAQIAALPQHRIDYGSTKGEVLMNQPMESHKN